MTWFDEFLTWDPADFDGLDIIGLSEDLIWTPNPYVSNSLSDTKHGAGSFARVLYDGKIIWEPVSVKETLCSLDITFYPFDTQKCDMVINMWTAPELEVYLNVLSARVDSDFFVENSEWQITDVTVEPKPSVYYGKRYSQFVVFFHLKRRRLFHTLTLVVPNVLLALLAGFVFLLPQECGEKMSFSMSLLLAFAVNLSVLVTAMPRSSLQVSLLMIYLTSLSVTTALFVVITVCLLRLYHEVGVMGPKVTAFTIWLRRLCGASRPVDVTIDTDDAQNHNDDHKLRHDCQTSSILSPNGSPNTVNKI
ncbi:neuronal acetylcholine receptor subunit alpha-6-like [Littorina saxatilis]|uniref:neuronal acetylcholine receptor subunit alpha-6-like n=1 Tax=Littorina saxatilis TaxID=31220 RepID=UPI0038B57600